MALVAVRLEGEVAVLTLNRPEKLNALSTALERELGGALDRDDVAGARAVVIGGAGRAFSAGADVTEMGDQTPDEVMRYYAQTGGVYERIASWPSPTIAAIHGYCLGGGFELALACDLRVASRDSTFGLPEVEIGILPSSGGTHRLVRIVGPARATELVFARRRLSADDAHRIGVVAEVVDGDATERALEIARDVGSLPPLAVRVTKRAIAAAAESGRDAALLIEQLAYATLAQTEAHEDATNAFSRAHIRTE